MRNSLLSWFLGTMLSGLTAIAALAQDGTISGKVTSAEDGNPIPGVSVVVKGTSRGANTDAQGNYRIQATTGQTLTFSFIGTQAQHVTIGSSNVINVALKQDVANLNEVVVTALGVKKEKRQLGYAVTEVAGNDLAQTQRDNFLNGLQGRVAGVNITTTSGMPGSSSQVVIRGINSISSNNQPLFVIDGMPIDNRTAQSGNFVAEKNSSSSFANRTVDFSNRASDINPADIESVTILKGPEAAALYGVDAANGAILITTKKGKSGAGRITYTNNFTIEKVGPLPKLQQIYGPGTNGVEQFVTSLGGSSTEALYYFGPKYPENTTFYNNADNFIQIGKGQRHNLSFEGGTERYSYRLSSSYSTREGVIPTTRYDRLNVSLAGTAKLTDKITSEATLQYIYTDNIKVSKGAKSFLLGMLQWPASNDMSNYVDPLGNRQRFTTSGTEIENPYFDVNKNKLRDLGNRVITNVSLGYTPTSWLTFSGRVGLDVSSTQYLIKYHPQSNRSGGTIGGSLDQSTDNNRNLTLQYYATLNRKIGKLKGTMRLGGALYDNNYRVLSTRGEKFLDPEFTSINNTDPLTQKSLSRLEQRRLVATFGDVTVNYDDIVYLTVTGRNDWSSTFPKAYRSFFYPSASLSFIFTELAANSGLRDILSYGKIRASLAQVGKEAPPYSTTQAYESQTTTGGGFSYNFTAPNPGLRPEKVTSFEIGTELKFFNNRLGIDLAYYKTRSVDQIIQGLRMSYGTGFILKTINGGEMWNKGVEISLNAEPIRTTNFSWNAILNFTKTNSRLVSLPNDLSEFYMSDTWVYSNIRNGARPGGPLTTLTGNSYQRNNKGEILISPITGLPLTETLWNVVADRNPSFSMGFSNQFSYKNLSLSVLLDIRKGGDVYNATELFLYRQGLSKNTINRENPVMFQGVLKDGLENTDTPTRNTIQVIPYYNNSYYGSLADENFIERNVSWVRLKDVTLRYTLPTAMLSKSRVFKTASVFFTGTDLLLITNYTGGDPGVNSVTASVGGSSGFGIDFGNLPLPKTYNLGISIGL